LPSGWRRLYDSVSVFAVSDNDKTSARLVGLNISRSSAILILRHQQALAGLAGVILTRRVWELVSRSPASAELDAITRRVVIRRNRS